MSKKKILIIDDEENFTRLLKLNLEATNKYEVKTVNNGSLSLSAAREFRPDLILLDIVMPGMDGGDVAHQLQNDEDTRDIRIVILTALVNKDQLKGRGGLIGGYPFIAKPVTAQELIDCIEKNTSEK